MALDKDKQFRYNNKSYKTGLKLMLKYGYQ